MHARAVGVVCGNDVSGVESIILGESSKPLRVIKDTGDTLHVSICADQPEQVRVVLMLFLFSYWLIEKKKNQTKFIAFFFLCNFLHSFVYAFVAVCRRHFAMRFV